METPDRILFVDDDEQVRKAFVRTLGHEGFKIDLAKDAWSAMKEVKRNDYAVIATDFRMPGLNGLQLTEELKRIQPDATYILISGNADLGLTLCAVNDHNLSYVIPKPWKADELISTLRRAQESAWERVGNRRVAASMVEASQNVAKKEAQLTEEIVRYEVAVEEALLGSLELKDRNTQAACRRVAASARRIAFALGLRGKQVDDIARGALLHDIGKMGIPDSILLKEGPLSEGEWVIMRTHTEIGGRLVGNLPHMRGARKIVEQHHEKWDGGGYPRGLRGPEICLGARILAVADTLDAILSDRPYRKGASYEVAREEIMRCSGTQFDPEVVRVFLGVPKRDWLRIRSQYPDDPSASEAA